MRAKFHETVNVLDIGHRLQLTGAIWSSPDTDYLLFLPDEQVREAGRQKVVLELTPAEWDAVVRQSDLLETEIVTKAPDGTLVKTLLRKSTRQIDQSVSWRVFRRDGYRCRYCGADDVPLTVDHAPLPWEQGGPSIEQNLVTACRKCNRAKGNLPYRDWIESSYYRQRCVYLSDDVQCANEKLQATLENIPRRLHIKSR